MAKVVQDLISYIPCLIWITGMSASGKTTLANNLCSEISQHGIPNYLLDGDKLRAGINSDLGFSELDRRENLRRAAYVAKLFLEKNFVVVGSFISPLHLDREVVKSIVGPSNYIEIFLDVSIDICRKRDPKGLYSKADKGLIADFTGVSQTYEKPVNPNLVFSGEFDVNLASKEILEYYLRG